MSIDLTTLRSEFKTQYQEIRSLIIAWLLERGVKAEIHELYPDIIRLPNGSIGIYAPQERFGATVISEWSIRSGADKLPPIPLSDPKCFNKLYSKLSDEL